MRSRDIKPLIYRIACHGRTFSTQPGVLNASIFFQEKQRPPKVNSLLGPSDQKFPLPGDVGHHYLRRLSVKSLPSLKHCSYSLEEIMDVGKVDVDRKSLIELQEKTLEMTKRNSGDWPIELKAQESPKLLRKDLQQLFPDVRIDKMTVVVLNLTQKTENDMAIWSSEMEQERDSLTSLFISSAMAICSVLRRCGYWADFVDPSSGRPYLGHYTNYTFCETNDAYKNMGFKIEDLGCCKIIQHTSWGRNAFVGTLFTNASLESQIVQDILREMNNS